MNSKLLFALATILASPAYAGDSTVTASPGSGGPIFHTKTDGSSNNFGFTAIGDGAAGAYSLTIKNASTAPAATDFAAVVGLSPNSIGGAVGNGMFVNPATGATFPVSGSVSITGSVAVTGTFWQATQPVSAASLPLPSGAATAAKQPSLGTAGSASADVITVQGIASMTALKTDGSAVTQPVSAASLPLPSGAATAANQTNVQSAAGSSASTLVTVQGAASGVAVPISAASLPLPSGASTSANQATEITSLGTIATNTGLLATDAHLTSTHGVIGVAAAPASMETVGAVYNSTPLNVGNGQSAALQADANGYLNVHLQTTALVNPGTAANWGVGATGAAPAANAVLQGTVVGGATGGLVAGLIQADSSVAINVSTATTTQLVALSSGRKIYVMALDVIAGGTGNITFEYGTGSTCGTGTTVLTGAYNLTAQAGIAKGSGLGPVLVIPAGNALCVLTTAAVQMSGSVAYAQF